VEFQGGGIVGVIGLGGVVGRRWSGRVKLYINQPTPTPPQTHYTHPSWAFWIGIVGGGETPTYE